MRLFNWLLTVTLGLMVQFWPINDSCSSTAPDPIKEWLETMTLFIATTLGNTITPEYGFITADCEI